MQVLSISLDDELSPQLIGALGRCFKHHWADSGFGLVSGGLHVEIE